MVARIAYSQRDDSTLVEAGVAAQSATAMARTLINGSSWIETSFNSLHRLLRKSSMLSSMKVTRELFHRS